MEKRITPLILIAALLVFGGGATYMALESSEQNPEPDLTLSGFNPAAGGTYRLQTSVGTTDTSLRLSSFEEPISELPITMASLVSDIAYGTIDPQSPTRKEFISFTGITQNADGTATLTGVTRGLAFLSPFTASTTLRKAHPGQSIFILSDPPQLFEEYAARRSNDVISGNWYITGAFGFTTAPTSTDECVATNEFCTKNYIDNTVNQGAATSTESIGGIVRLGTALQQASSTNLGSNDPTVLQTKNATDTPQYGCAAGYTGTAGAGCSVIATLAGKIRQTFLDIFSTANTWTAHNIFSSLNATVASTTNATSTNHTVTGQLNVNGTVVGNISHLVSVTTDTAGVVSNNAEQTIFTATVPANTLGSFGILKAKLYVPIVQCHNGSSVIFQAKYAGTSFASSSISCTNTSTMGGYYEATLIATTSTSAQTGWHVLSFGVPQWDVDDGATNKFAWGFAPTTTPWGYLTKDSTASQTFLITVQFADALSDNKIYVQNGYLEVIR